MTNQRIHGDAGSVLPLTLVVSVIMSMLVLGLANYTISDLRFGNVVEDRADRLSAAEAGLRHMLEQEQEANSLCTTAAGAGGGTTFTLPGTISEASVQVHCRQVDGTLSAITAWAVVVTGEGGVPAGQGLVTAGGAGRTKVFGGPSYIANKSLLGVNVPLEMRDGNLWFTESGCDSGGAYDGTTVTDLTFSPASRGLWCTDKEWESLFPEPAIASVSTASPNPPYQDIAGCRVFEPGYYTTAPDFGTNSYMKSGNYLFHNTGTISITKTTVTIGREGVAGGQQEVDNATCDAQRDADVATGATVYLGGDSHIEVSTQGALEILRRQQNNDFVSLHALPVGHSMASTLDYNTHVVTTGPGSNKQMVIQGMVYAPRASIEFGNVSNAAAAQLSGGAIVARLEAQAAASASGFVIQVQGSPQSDRLAYTATATKNGTTEVRVIAQVRFAPPASGSGVGTWELVMNSWRVCDTAC